MSPKTILITGCNRGIGLELVKQYLKAATPPTHLFATCRDPAKAEELTALEKSHSGQLHVLTLDVTDHDAYPKIAAQVGEIVGDAGLNLVINNAGVLPNEITNPVTPQVQQWSTFCHFYIHLR